LDDAHESDRDKYGDHPPRFIGDGFEPAILPDSHSVERECPSLSSAPES